MLRKALIVAAGSGLRLRPETDTVPKPALAVGGVPLIRRSVDILAAHGVSDVTVVVGYEQDQIRALLGDSVSYLVNEDFASTNNMASMYVGRHANADEPFLYLHADLWYDPAIIELAGRQTGDIVFLVEEKLCGDEEMKVRVEDGLLLEADKAVPPAEAYGEWLGITKFEPQGASVFFDEIGRTLPRSRMLYDCAVVRDLAERGIAMEYADIGRLPWVEIDFLEDLEYARSLARREEQAWPS
jgi:choline kinase